MPDTLHDPDALQKLAAGVYSDLDCFVDSAMLHDEHTAEAHVHVFASCHEPRTSGHDAALRDVTAALAARLGRRVELVLCRQEQTVVCDPPAA